MDLFEQLTLAVPSEHRSIQARPGKFPESVNECWFGVPSHRSRDWDVLQRIPEEATAFNFLLGNECTELFSAFARSPWARTVKSLSVGASCYYKGARVNYEDVSKIVAATKFPALERLDLGVWELFSNSHGSYGKLGDITDLFENCPSLKVLNVMGNFELSRPIAHGKLMEIVFGQDDYVTSLNGGGISNETLRHLLCGIFPNLRALEVATDIHKPAIQYSLPEEFLRGVGLPMLRKLYVSGNFGAHEEERLQGSALAKIAHIDFEATDE